MVAFNRIIGSIQSLQVIWTVSHFMPCVWSQVSKKMPMKIPCNSKSEQPVPMQPSGWAFEGVRTPLRVQQITMKTSGHQSNTVRMLGQSVFNKELDFKSRHCLGSLCKLSGRCPVKKKIDF